MPAVDSGGCWHLDWFRVDGQSIRLFRNSNCSMRMSTFHAFFVTWFRARTRVRWVASVISVFFVRID